MDKIFEVKNISRQIEDRMLWQNISFSLKAGDILALKGPSGSGKTVMLRTLAGLEPIQGGTVLYKSKSQTSYEMPIYRSQIIYLQQRPSFATKTVLESLKAPFAFKVHERKKYNPDLVLGYLKDLGRDKDFLNKEITKLSGGEEQILALIRVLQLKPQIILLDEATASLDDQTSQKLEQLISYWVGQDSRACIWVSHELKQLQRLANVDFSL